MALDATFALLAVRPESFDVTDDFGPQLQQALGSRPRQWGVRLVEGGFELLDGTIGAISNCKRLATLLDGRWLVSRGSSAAALADTLYRLVRSGGSFYGELEAAGFTVVAPGSEAALNGGSFATVRLRQRGESVVVEKEVDGAPRDDLDSWMRLVSERAWLKHLGPQARALFPHMLSGGAPLEAQYSSQFVHGYTLSERLFHGTLGARDSVGILTRVLTDLRTSIYEAQPPTVPIVPDGYADRIRRRLARLATAASGPDGARIRALMSVDAPVVNGVACMGLRTLLDALFRERWVERLDSRFRLEYAHGDLILDDIVWDAAARRALLVDPSGRGSSRVYDIGKLCLSLSTYYEFFKYDQFELSMDRHGNGLNVDIRLLSRRVRETYDVIAHGMPEVLRASGVTDRQFELSGPDLLLINGLQNLALPMFHFLRHRNEPRALAFMALGILRLTQYAVCCERPPLPTVRDVFSREVYDTGILL